MAKPDDLNPYLELDQLPSLVEAEEILSEVYGPVLQRMGLSPTVGKKGVRLVAEGPTVYLQGEATAGHLLHV